MSVPKKELSTIYVLWPGDTSAKHERVSSTRSIAMLMGGPYKDLIITEYGRDTRVTYYRIDSTQSALIGFYVVRHGESFPARATDHEHNVLQSDAIRYAAAQKIEKQTDEKSNDKNSPQ